MGTRTMRYGPNEDLTVFREGKLIATKLHFVRGTDWVPLEWISESRQELYHPMTIALGKVIKIDTLAGTLTFAADASGHVIAPAGASAEIKHGKLEDSPFNPDTSRRFQPTPIKPAATPIHVLEAKEFIQANTLAASVIEAQEDGGISRQSIDRHERAIRDLLRTHRFDVLAWLTSLGVDVPLAAWHGDEHPPVGQQYPDRPRPVAPPAS